MNTQHRAAMRQCRQGRVPYIPVHRGWRGGRANHPDLPVAYLLVQKHAPHLRHVLLRGVADQLAACQFAGGAIILLLIVLWRRRRT